MSTTPDWSNDCALEPTQRDACRAMSRCPTMLSNAYFSQANIQRVQHLIQRQIAQRLGYMISDQSEATLINIMRNTYLTYGMFRDTDIQGQVDSLNDTVVKLVLPDIASSIKAYLVFLKDASSVPTPPPLPQVVSVKATRQQPVFKGFW